MYIQALGTTSLVGLKGNVSGAPLYNGSNYGALQIGTVSGVGTVVAESDTMVKVTIAGAPAGGGWIDRGNIQFNSPPSGPSLVEQFSIGLVNLVAPKPVVTSPAPASANAPLNTIVSTPTGPKLAAKSSSTLPLLLVAGGVALYLATKKK